MDTPICDFVRQYAAAGTARLHMPGHKGHGPLGCEALDITEVDGADDLYHTRGVIAQSQANAARLFGAGRTLYSAGGSSQCIRAMVYLACQTSPAGRKVILAARNAHKSFLSACALCDCDVVWLYGGGENSICSCRVEAGELDRALSALAAPPAAVYLTSPDYLGQMADVAALSRVCRAHGVPLLVDNAHGAYLHFLPAPCHPMDLGADACCDSAHKTLSVLTGGAYLHLSRTAPALWQELAEDAMALFGSSSPSYLILQSLDACNAALAGDWPGRLARRAAELDGLKARLAADGVPILPGEPLKLTVDAAAMGCSGEELSDRLRAQGGECEFSDQDYLVAMLTPDNPPEDLELLQRALSQAPRRAPLPRKALRAPALPRACTIRQAMFAPHTKVRIEDAIGRICGVPTVSCPPAVPIAVSGEVITREAAECFRAYHIDQIAVVAERSDKKDY